MSTQDILSFYKKSEFRKYEKPYQESIITIQKKQTQEEEEN